MKNMWKQAVLASSVLTSAGVAYAQETSGSHVDEVIITATRQSASAQDVPIPLTAVGADQLAEEGITSALQLEQLAPSMVTFSESAGSPRFIMRGIGSDDTSVFASAAVALYVDDVYQGSQFGTSNALFDIQRIEILRGPQGTTFGRNTTGGAVAYYTQRPTDVFEGHINARVAGGDQNQQIVEAVLNVPITSTLAMRAGVTYENFEDFVPDLARGVDIGGADSQTARVAFRWTPSAATDVNLSVYGTRHRGFGPIYHAAAPGAVADVDAMVTSPALDIYDNFDNQGATLQIEHQLGSMTFNSITHYRSNTYDAIQDVDGLVEDWWNYSNWSSHRQYGQEFRLATDASQPLSGVIGVYFEKQDIEVETNEFTIDANPIFYGGDFNNSAHIENEVETIALFGSFTANLTDDLYVTAGARVFNEERSTDYFKAFYIPGAFDWTQDTINSWNNPAIVPTGTLAGDESIEADETTWDATLGYQATDDILLYARAARGFRSGGFRSLGSVTHFSTSAADVPTTSNGSFEGETVQSYEAGIKSAMYDHRLIVNATIFRLNYDNQQVVVYPFGVPDIQNAGASVIDGAEIEVQAVPTDALSLRASVSYNNARYIEYEYFDVLAGVPVDNAGNRVIRAPEISANASATYTVPVSDSYELKSTVGASYRSQVFFEGSNDPLLSDDALTRVNLRFALDPMDGTGVSVALFGNNITNERRLMSGFHFFDYGTFQDYNLNFFDVGASYGVALNYSF